MATQDDFIRTALRVPPDLHKAIHDAAANANRTFNAEIVDRLEESLDFPGKKAAQEKLIVAGFVLRTLQNAVTDAGLKDDIATMARFISDTSGKDEAIAALEVVIRLQASHSPKTEWAARGYTIEYFSVMDGKHVVYKLGITDEAARPNDAHLIYTQVDRTTRMLGGSNGTLWLDISVDHIPVGVHDGVKRLVGFGTPMVVTMNGQSTLSTPDAFPERFMTDLSAAVCRGKAWCPIEQKLKHLPFE